jgi:hypothetical protein
MRKCEPRVKKNTRRKAGQSYMVSVLSHSQAQRAVLT